MSNYQLTSLVRWNPANVFSGGSGNDKITGGDGDDNINGGEDNDTLIGSAGFDFIQGNTGNDTFNYQTTNGFTGFAPSGTTQTLDGGPNDPLISANEGLDIIKLPGSAKDYRFRVSFGTTWEQTSTTIETLEGNGLAKVSLNTKDIEKALFQTPIDNKVNLTARSLTVEMALLTKEVYGLLKTLEHKAEPLLSDALGLPRSTETVLRQP